MRAFTIIEVVLVLAIAALIFLMVFIAIPSAQRAQRDQQRRNDMSKILSQLESYKVNNHGRQVSDSNGNKNSSIGWNYFEKNYLQPDTEYRDPRSGERYKVGLWNSSLENPSNKGITGWGNDPAVGEFWYNAAGDCIGDKMTDDSGEGPYMVVRTQLESGGFVCLTSKGAGSD